MKAGDRWKSKTSDLGFTITKVLKGSISVTVDTYVRKGGKHAPAVVEQRERVIRTPDWRYFSRGYEEAK